MSGEVLFGQNRLRAELDVDVMALHEEIGKQSRIMERLCRHARDLAFEFQSLQVPKSLEALRSLSERAREIGNGSPEELGRAAEMTGRLASLLLEQAHARDKVIIDATGKLTVALVEVQTYRVWGKDFEIALSSYEIAKGRAKQAKTKGEDLTEIDGQKRPSVDQYDPMLSHSIQQQAAKRQCQVAGLAAVARMLGARSRVQSASVTAAVMVSEAYEEYIRTSLDSLAPIAHSRSALASHIAAAPSSEVQLESIFPSIFEGTNQPGSLSSSGSGSAPSSPMHLGPPPMPPPPEHAPPSAPAEQSSSASTSTAVLSPRWAGQHQRAGDASGPASHQWGTASVPDMSSKASTGANTPGWGKAIVSADGIDLRGSQSGWNGARSGSSRPSGTARIQLGAGKTDANPQFAGAQSLPTGDSRLADHRPPSPLPSPRAVSPSPRAMSPQRATYSKALPPVPPSPSSGRSPASGPSSGRSAAPERERSHGAAPPSAMVLGPPLDRKGSGHPNPEVNNSRFVYEAQKVSKAKLQSLMPGTLEVDLEARTIATYHVKKQTRKVYPADSLMKVQRSKVDARKMKIYWSKKETPQRYHMMSQDERERFIEVAFWAKYLVTQPLSTPFVPRLAAPLQEEVSVWIGSWNMGNAGPPADLTLLEAWMPRGKHDLYVTSVQECEFPHAPGYSTCEEEWFSKVSDHLGDSYVRLAGLSLLAIRLLVLVKKEHAGKITQLQKAKEATGIAGVYGNKGGVGVSFYFNETCLAFVGAHLAARDERVKQRNDNYRDIVSGLRIAREPFTFATFCDHSFFCGDLNYRLTTPRDKTLEAIKAGKFDELLADDQLNTERSQGNCFADFKEGTIKFQPTYRYNRGDRTFSDEKMRTPSWCDRVLWRSLPGLEAVQTSYAACSAMTTSDHNAISATFRLNTLLANVPHIHVPSRLSISNIRVELTGEAIAPKPPTDPHLVWYCSLTEEPKSTRSLKRQGLAVGGNGHVWGDDEPHVLVPLVHNREWVHTRHVQVCVKDHRGEYGQAVLSLQAVCDGRPVPFQARLMLRGRDVGCIKGEIQFAPEAPDQRRKPSGTPNSSNNSSGGPAQHAEEKCGYLLKQGATRKNWKRRWFECRGGTMTYTLNRDAKQQFGSFSIRGATISEAPGNVGKQHCISVTTPKRVWLLCADSFDDMRGWLDHLKRQAQLPA